MQCHVISKLVSQLNVQILSRVISHIKSYYGIISGKYVILQTNFDTHDYLVSKFDKMPSIFQDCTMYIKYLHAANCTQHPVAIMNLTIFTSERVTAWKMMQLSALVLFRVARAP